MDWALRKGKCLADLTQVVHYSCVRISEGTDDNFLLQLEKLSDKQCQPESQLKFIIEAWLQVNFNFHIEFLLTSGIDWLH